MKLKVLHACALAGAVLTSGRMDAAVNGPIKVSGNGRYFTEANGTPFLWLGDTAWPLLVQYSQAQAENYLSRRSEQGFTVIQSVIAWGSGSGMESELPDTNCRGDRPWKNNDPAVPDEDYFRYVDHLVDFAGERGLVMAMMPTWGFYITDSKTINLQNARAYGRWLGNRYKNAPNIIWVSGGDRIPLGFEDVYRELALGLREGDGGSHLIGYHPSGWRSSSEFFHDERWLDFNMIQTWTEWSKIYYAVISDGMRTPVKPVVLSEGAYEEGPEYPQGPITPLIVRRQAWWAVMAGGSMTYGHTQNWRMDEGWEKMYDAPGAAQVCLMRKILSRFEWWDMVPDQGVFLYGIGSERTLNAALRAKKGDRALIYLSTQCRVTVNLEKFKVRKVRALWINPVSGEQQEAGDYLTGNYNGRVWPDRAEANFTVPGHWEDALLLIEAII